MLLSSRLALKGASVQTFRPDEQSPGVQVSAERSLSFSRAHPRPGELSAEPVWLLINDFSIMQMPRGEAMQLFGGHKLPCLLYYTQVIHWPESALGLFGRSH